MRGVKFCISMLAATVFIVATMVVTGITWTPSKPVDISIKVAHAEVTSPVQGCAKCHQDKISVACTTCHTKLVTIKLGRAFPHHAVPSVGPPNTCQISVCHGGDANDVRYVKVSKASDSYCAQCHG